VKEIASSVVHVMSAVESAQRELAAHSEQECDKVRCELLVAKSEWADKCATTASEIQAYFVRSNPEIWIYWKIYYDLVLEFCS
jgi:hypothetical protein